MEVQQNRPEMAAGWAKQSIGMGYDFNQDISFPFCKGAAPLVQLHDERRTAVVPGGIRVPDVSKSIRIVAGETQRLTTGVLSFEEMSKKFNKEQLKLTDKTPSGLFNAMFGFHGRWQNDAFATKGLAFDGIHSVLYSMELEAADLKLLDHVKKEVPSTWDPAALARFIEKYGTHIIVGVKMGGKDVIHVKQQSCSSLQPGHVQELLKRLADDRFSYADTISSVNQQDLSSRIEEPQARPVCRRRVSFSFALKTISQSEHVVSICIRKGGIDTGQGHNEWLATIPRAPDVISMSFVPITSLLKGLPGSEFLGEAIRLYLIHKPAKGELHNFFEYQHQRQWIPAPDDSKQPCPIKLQFTMLGPKLNVNTRPVDSGKKPVTGIRLFLEGDVIEEKLTIHIQHLSSLPAFLILSNELAYGSGIVNDKRQIKPLSWRHCSHVCIAPVECTLAMTDKSAWIVTRANLEVQKIQKKKVLFLKLGFSLVENAKVQRSEWGRASTPTNKSGTFSRGLSKRIGISQAPVAAEELDLISEALPSSLAPRAGGPRTPKTLKYVDTREVARGPDHFPGYWVVTGAKLCAEDGKMSLRVKYSLLTTSDDEDA
ncbi:MACPF domain-containing protein NSL1-like [Nymphaea colorata]|nr:MACPF domain-containing protein NSL1-like [Nymphaea colorata]